MAYFDTNPSISFEPDNDLPKIPLDNTKDEEFAHRYIIKLGKLLAPLRAVVPTWENKESGEYNCPFIASLKLFRLAKDSGVLLLFISESATFCPIVQRKQHVHRLL